MMDFFEHQARARRQTGRLVVLFIIAVVLIVLVVNLAAALIFTATQSYEPAPRPAPRIVRFDSDGFPIYERPTTPPPAARASVLKNLWHPEVYLPVTLVTLLVIVSGSLYKMATLSAGGRAVAALLGGRPLAPNSGDPDDRKLQNVVEEMAIASGVPVPAIYVLADEPGINAFAAGFSPRDAVIGVTEGCMRSLNRDELQGVIAHEFSHILNGDMRLNLRLVGILHGILVIGILGYILIRSLMYSRPRSSSRRDEKGGGGAMIALFIFGVVLIVVGYVGVFFGRLIQAAVSRQREFLADASSVQFTRNPSGLANALKKIGGNFAGSQVQNPQAVGVQHMFFGGAVSAWTSLLATHPPLEERIHAIDPNWDGQFIRGDASRAPEPSAEPAPAPSRLPFPGPGVLPLQPQQLAAAVGTWTPRHVDAAARTIQSIPQSVQAAAREPFSARAIVFSLLLDRDSELRQGQIEALKQHADTTVIAETARLFPAIAALGDAGRLPLLNLAIPALRHLSRTQVDDFFAAIKVLVECDQQVSLREYTLYKIVAESLRASRYASGAPPVQFYALRPLLPDVATLLSALASSDGKDESAAFASFSRGLAALHADPASAYDPSPSCAAIDQALRKLDAAAPAIKRQVIEACAHCVTADGFVSVGEAELLRAVALTLNCPLPPLLKETESTGGDSSSLPNVEPAGNL